MINYGRNSDCFVVSVYIFINFHILLNNYKYLPFNVSICSFDFRCQCVVCVMCVMCVCVLLRSSENSIQHCVLCMCCVCVSNDEWVGYLMNANNLHCLQIIQHNFVVLNNHPLIRIVVCSGIYMEISQCLLSRRCHLPSVCLWWINTHSNLHY